MHAVGTRIAQMRAAFADAQQNSGDVACTERQKCCQGMHTTSRSFQKVLERDMGRWERRSKRAAAALSVAAKLMRGMATGGMATGGTGSGIGTGTRAALHVRRGVAGGTEMAAWAAQRGVRVAEGIEDPCATFLMVKWQVRLPAFACFPFE